MQTQTKQEFIRLFNDLCQKRHRYEVFRDFITCVSAALHNAVVKSEALEERYMEVVDRYPKEDVAKFATMLPILIELLDEAPRDVLGQLYMELEIGSDHMGQYFSPPEISSLMAKLNRVTDVLEHKPHITIHEPACGSGGMVLAIVSEVIDAKYNPAVCMWAQCIDIDRTAAMMCFIQLTLWNVPAEIVVGNSLTMKFEEVYYTPAHYLNDWEGRLKSDSMIQALQELLMTEPNDSLEQIANANNGKQKTEVADSNKPILEPPKTFEIRSAGQMTLDL
ncbi:MAG: N-6 DNA methylase [Gammaproteobacteria bacterium]|nr:N-6 DNA methylase [Gammaproteobacteria bacterium]